MGNFEFNDKFSFEDNDFDCERKECERNECEKKEDLFAVIPVKIIRKKPCPKPCPCREKKPCINITVRPCNPCDKDR